MLRDTLPHPDLAPLVDDTDDGPHLERRERELLLRIPGDIDPDHAAVLEEAVWERMSFASHLRVRQLGEFTLGTDLLRSESLALVQVILLYHLVSARAALAVGGRHDRREPARAHGRRQRAARVGATPRWTGRRSRRRIRAWRRRRTCPSPGPTSLATPDPTSSGSGCPRRVLSRSSGRDGRGSRTTAGSRSTTRRSSGWPTPSWIPRTRPRRSPYTAEERTDELPSGVWEAVHGYLIDHPEVEGYVDVRWRDERRTFVVGIIGDPEPHRAPLARVAGGRVIVERRSAAPRLTDTEVEALVVRIEADRRQLAQAGLSVENLPGSSYGFDVHVVGGPDEHTVAELITARYGDAVSVVWLGPHRYVEPLRTFGSWTSAGRWVRVFFSLDPNGEKPGEARVAEETDERVVIALSAREPVSPFRTLLGGFVARAADVELRTPVGDRVVIDASAGVPRPSLAQLPRQLDDETATRVRPISVAICFAAVAWP